MDQPYGFTGSPELPQPEQFIHQDRVPLDILAKPEQTKKEETVRTQDKERGSPQLCPLD